MIRYAVVGSNDLEAAKKFYDGLMASIGVPQFFDHPSGGRIYGTDFHNIFFGVLGPFDGKPATVGNGTMIGWHMKSRKEVDDIHATALALGGSDEGAPGWRGDPSWGLYVAYFRDLDGNKFSAMYVGTE